MKRAILSDIHGNLEALEAVLDDARRQRIDEILCLGDVVTYGPNPRECLERAMCWPACLLGGDDLAVREVLAGQQPSRGPVERDARHAACAADQLRVGPPADVDRRTRFLNHLDATAIVDGMLFVHGSPRWTLDEHIFPEDVYNSLKIAKLFALIDRHCFHGKSHIPGVITADEKFYGPDDCGGRYRLSGEKALIDVGSVGQPRDGDHRACYVILDDEMVEFRRVEYPFEITHRKLETNS
ncbi:MAG TPA: metallophosphoesterase family protein [Pirellulales bacterium]|nr:metallophosphoesterase family protein [Pirellulales bacterium]